VRGIDLNDHAAQHAYDGGIAVTFSSTLR